MRVAWIGPMPSAAGGVAYMANQLLRDLPTAGVDVDAFVAGPGEEIPPELHEVEGLTMINNDIGWRYDRWYSNAPVTKVLTSLGARALAQRQLVASIARRHADTPYDVLYQFSQIELFAVRRRQRQLPPVVLHPEVHAAGELRWHARESAMVRRFEGLGRHGTVRAMLLYRSLVQRRDAKIPRRIICPSAAFAREIGDDYGVPPGRLDVVPNPVDLKRFHATEPWEPPSGPLRIRFISRIAVRKGVELVVELSHRLDDLAEQIHLDVVGGESLWSDYRPLLRRLNPRIASFDGGVWPDETAELYRSTDIFIQPSHYEPFALTVAEALASGVPVVVSDAVGAGEQVDRRCCRVFPAGDAAALEREVRALAIEMSQPDSARVLRQLAREEAERLFDPSKVARMIADVLQAARS